MRMKRGGFAGRGLELGEGVVFALLGACIDPKFGWGHRGPGVRAFGS